MNRYHMLFLSVFITSLYNQLVLYFFCFLLSSQVRSLLSNQKIEIFAMVTVFSRVGIYPLFYFTSMDISVHSMLYKNMHGLRLLYLLD